MAWAHCAELIGTSSLHISAAQLAQLSLLASFNTTSSASAPQSTDPIVWLVSTASDRSTKTFSIASESHSNVSEPKNTFSGTQGSRTLMTDLLQDSHAISPLPYQHHAPRIRNRTDYSSKPDKPLPLAPSTCPRPITSRNEQTSRRHARVWDPTEVTEALRTFTPGSRSNHHADITQHAKPQTAIGQEKIYIYRNQDSGWWKGNPNLRLASKEPPPVPPKDNGVASTTNIPIKPTLPQAIKVQNLAPTCSICLDNTNDFPRHAPSSKCAHPPSICTPCLGQYISHSVITDGLTLITCPIPDCRQTLGNDEVIRGAKGDITCLIRYETLLLRRTLESDPDFVYCHSPSCNWGQIHRGGAESPLVTCKRCGSQSCSTHNIPWHTGFTCKQFDDDAKLNARAQRLKRDRARTQDRKSEKYIRGHTKRCPNPSCGRQIQKNGGCDHMTCVLPAGCGHEFCWLCRADYSLIRWKGNQRHRIYCKHYRPHWPKRILRMRWRSS